MQSLQNKRTLITGGSSGIGLGTARQFIAEGASVIISGTNQAALDDAVAALGPNAFAVRADASQLSDIELIVDAVRRRFGGLDAAFLNAGLADFRPLDQWDYGTFDRSIAVNLKCPFFLMLALLPLLANPGSIILNASTNARFGMAASSVYAAAKAALISLAHTLSAELTGRGVRVSSVRLASVATPLYDKLTRTGAVFEEMLRQVPMARVVALLASDAGAFGAGRDFVLDGVLEGDPRIL